MDDSFPEPFENLPVPAGDLPDYRAVDFEGVAPAFRRYTLLSSAVGSAPFLLAAPVLERFGDVPTGLVHLGAGAIFALAVLSAVHRWVDAGFRGWALRDHDLIARQGVFWRSVVALPIARIQHVETTSGPLERGQGLARLKIFTAGGVTADLTVVGLEADTADRLRVHLVEQIRLRDSAAAGAAAGARQGAASDADSAAPDPGERGPG